jgi:GT2 family glycosyltransferase
MKKPILTIYIVHHNKLEQLKNTINNLRRNTATPFYLKILNNGYIDEKIKNYFEELEKENNTEIIYSQINLGPAGGRAKIVNKIKTPYLMALDDDIYLEKNWDRPILKRFKEDKNVDAIGIIIRNKEYNFWTLYGGKILIRNKKVKIDYPKIKNCENKFIKVDDISSGAIVYRARLKKIIRWDKNFKINFEDLDKGLVLFKKNCNCLISVESKAIHDKVSQKARFREYNLVRRNYHQIRKDYLYFVKKNNLKFDLGRHIFYKYLCLLPNSILRSFSYIWLNLKKR